MENINHTEESKISISEVAVLIWKKRLPILKYTGIFFIVGIIIAFSIPKEYTCTVKMVPEGAKPSISGNVSNLAAMAGISIGTGNVDGINLTLYPDVVKSIPFLCELVKLEIPTDDDSKQTLYTYIDKGLKKPWWNSAVTLPFKLLDIFSKGKNEPVDAINPYYLSRDQELNLLKLNDRINISIDKKTGIISVGIIMQDPEISALLADSLVTKLERYVIAYRTNKAKEDFLFASKMFEEAKQKYFESQRKYARYMDENKNIILETVRIEQERLRNEQMLSYNVYSSLAQQVETAKLKVQEQTPCLTIIEPARIPAKKSSASKLRIMIGFILLGILSGTTLKVIYPNWHKM